ncbi:UDP-glucose--hexose-1-phosphate uridylyltransferase [Proteocatella sphenisci]|uniref:UDP-glucose--hexose-1-phosphate uridylyltransferase n=1 Tax=Proteocatella sphenisci TaxID=181070 RepID=UPI00048A4CE0|nr:UDP-glucose--hexose-1-phosphate uridylyltransferase [Proteocatella sphenisci]
MISKYINQLICYALQSELLDPADKTFATNSLMDLFEIDEPDYYDEFEPGQEDAISPPPLSNILDSMLDYAIKKDLLKKDTSVNRDLFDTRIMGLVTPNPSNVISRFDKLYKVSPKSATDFFYKFSQDNNYIRRDRIEKDIQWKTQTEYGEMDITINLSKPEKDPRDIAAEKNAKQSGYPKCLLCMENEGYRGRINHPARQNHRIIPVTINSHNWGFQYSPYVYYNEHCIVLSSKHSPMKIDDDTFVKLFDFVKLFPHYFVGSNADLPIVGGSILSHDHFQGGNYEFAMAKAGIEKQFKVKGFEDVECGIVKWPMSVIRLRHKDTQPLIDLARHILERWRNYSDPKAFVFAFTDDTLHNAITPIARKKGQFFEMDLVLRNNITTKEHPMGVYHPHEEFHNIKKENIGLIEVMGLAVLPSRLKEEIALLAEALVKNEDISKNEKISHHSQWASDIVQRHSNINLDNVDQILREEIGKTFATILSHAGVFKRNPAGSKAFDDFLNSLS